MLSGPADCATGATSQSGSPWTGGVNYRRFEAYEVVHAARASKLLALLAGPTLVACSVMMLQAPHWHEATAPR